MSDLDVNSHERLLYESDPFIYDAQESGEDFEIAVADRRREALNARYEWLVQIYASFAMVLVSIVLALFAWWPHLSS